MNVEYFTNFIVYAFAMSGVLLTAVFVYKKFCSIPNSDNKCKFLSIKDQICIAPRKNLYVVQAGKEYFLIAGDAERTTMLSKLNAENEIPQTFTKTSWEDNINNKKILQRINERFKN